ncbi:MAG TPA: thiamine-phosphate pyrophosphorylase [Candidatus Omnitrophica bacterium]|nr:thiamine-phosphate pyrophosphorylase [Candidatus Omnitrophota bacterium]
MQKIEEKKLLRIVDANFNRAKEGLRVCEDICRFVIDSKSLTRNFKDVRHDLTEIISSLKFKTVIFARDIEGDIGKGSTVSEFKREKLFDVFVANSQRAKESVRVLEEFSKLLDIKLAQKLKSLRYKIYAYEKKVIEKL